MVNEGLAMAGGALVLGLVLGLALGLWLGRRPRRGAVPAHLTQGMATATPQRDEGLGRPTAPVDLPSQIAAGEAQRLRESLEEMAQTLEARDARIAALEADMRAAQSEALVAPATRRSAFSEAIAPGMAQQRPGVEAVQPLTLAVARGNAPDDLKRIHGIGAALEALLHRMGYFHFDQIAGWTEDEVAWVDENLPGFKGRVSRDDWVGQARALVAAAPPAPAPQDHDLPV